MTYYIDHGINKGTEIRISDQLRALRKHEPPNTPSRLVLRCTIAGYELGAVQQFAVRAVGKNISPSIRAGYEENAKLGLADLVIQLRMICLDNYWNFNDLQTLGIEHLRERHAEIAHDGWGEE